MDSEYIVIEPQQQEDDDFQVLESESQEHHASQTQSSLSVRLNECYVVIPIDEAHRQFHTDSEWDDFLHKTYLERKIGMCIVDLNSIIGISVSDVCRRQQIWKTVTH